MFNQKHQERKQEVVPADVAVDIHIKFDRLLGGLVSQLWRAGGQISCAAGCFSCCYEPVHILRHEAELLVQVVEDMSEADQKRVRDSTRTWVTGFLKAGLEKVNNPNAVPFRLAKLPCPFLKDGQCMVYEDRPVACRGHLAVKDERLCHDNATRPDQEFLVTRHLVGKVFSQVATKSGVEADHLGVWMTEYLLGEKIESSSRSGLGRRGAEYQR